MIVSRASLHKIVYTIQPIHNTRVSMDSENFNNHHGTSTAFLTNFTNTVKLTKTLIACHYWRWNSFSCDYFNKSWKLLESGFPDRYFGRSMWDRKPYCELSSHSLHACACTCTFVMAFMRFPNMAFPNSDIWRVRIFFFFFFFSRACRRWVFWSYARRARHAYSTLARSLCVTIHSAVPTYILEPG